MTFMARALAGKTIIITGGAEGIGRGMALAVARAGANVIISGRNAEKGEEAVATLSSSSGMSGTISYFRADVSQASQVEALVDFAVRRTGHLDGAINNAAYVGDFKLLADESEESFDRVLDTNVKGVFLCMKYEIGQMLRQARGADTFSIVNIGSSAVRRTNPGIGPYVASKLAIEGLTRSAAVEYSSQGIRVNSVAFGVFKTPLSEAFYAANPAVYSQDLASHRIGRLGDAVLDAGAAAVFLLSSQSAFMTGSVFELDGGFHL